LLQLDDLSFAVPMCSGNSLSWRLEVIFCVQFFSCCLTMWLWCLF